MKYCLGTVQFGMDYGIHGGQKPSDLSVQHILDKARKNKITNLDTAAVYGDAEKRIGEYIRTMGGDKPPFQIVSKMNPAVLRDMPREKWRKTVADNIRTSLDNLHIECLEGYLFHDAFSIFDRAAVETLYSVVEDGYARQVGVSVYTLDEAMKALEYEEISIIQIPYNLMDHRLDAAGFFEKTRKKDVKVYARSPLLQGLLTMNPADLSEGMQFARPYLEKYRNICNSYGISPLEAAIAYVHGHEGIDYLLFGIDDEKQLDDYIAMKDMTIPNEMREELNRAFWSVEDRLVNPMLWGNK